MHHTHPQAMVEMLRVEASSLAHKVEGLEEECEERSSQANTWYEALKVRRPHAQCRLQPCHLDIHVHVHCTCHKNVIHMCGSPG